jgi:hypothetical protein
MTQTSIKAVELVCEIRNQHYELLKDRSREETKASFHREATAANTGAERLLEQEGPASRVGLNTRLKRSDR